jgi:hypothetical protein
LPAVVNPGVIPVERPSVDSALIASNIRAMKSRPAPPARFSVSASPRVASACAAPKSTTTAIARKISGIAMRRPKTCASGCPRSVAITATAITATVVRRTPPAVDAGAPPIAMATIITNNEAALASPRSMVANPPLRVATLWKIATIGRAQIGV